MTVSRRNFLGGVAAGLGYLKVGSEVDLFAQGQGAPGRTRPPMDEYDSIAHLSSNENCWGPPETVLKAMNQSFKYAMRYGYPGGDVVGEVAKLHGVKQENILLTAGSGEVLDVVGTTFLMGGKKVFGVEPSYSSVYQHATSDQVVGDQAAARQGLSPEHSGDHQGRQRPRRRTRVRVSLQPEQPDRRDRHRRKKSSSCSTASRRTCRS